MQTRQHLTRVTQIKRVTILTTIVALLLAMFPTGAGAANQNENPRPVSAMAQGYCTYVIRPGDTLYAIAARYHVSVQYLAALNSILCPNCIFAGAVLRVPCGGAPSGAICAYHTVQPGERLFRIAMRYGVSWQAIAAANYIPNPNLIFPWTRLAIPCGGWVPTPTPQDAFNQTANDLKQTGKVDQVNARLRDMGLIPADKSVLGLLAPERAAGWTNKSACSQSASRPYQILAAPVFTDTTATSGTLVLMGVTVLPACTLNQVLPKGSGFALLPSDGTEPTLYAMVANLGELLYFQQYRQKQLSYSQAQVVTTTVTLDLIAPTPNLDRRDIPGSSRYMQPEGPTPRIELGSYCIPWDSQYLCWPPFW